MKKLAQVHHVPHQMQTTRLHPQGTQRNKPFTFNISHGLWIKIVLHSLPKNTEQSDQRPLQQTRKSRRILHIWNNTYSTSLLQEIPHKYSSPQGKTSTYDAQLNSMKKKRKKKLTYYRTTLATTRTPWAQKRTSYIYLATNLAKKKSQSFHGACLSVPPNPHRRYSSVETQKPFPTDYDSKNFSITRAIARMTTFKPCPTLHNTKRKDPNRMRKNLILTYISPFVRNAINLYISLYNLTHIYGISDPKICQNIYC